MSALATSAPAVLADLNIAWITTRAAGIVALLTSTASIVLGLALAGRLAKGRGVLGDVRILHQTLGIATVVALAVHVVALAFDPWLKPTIAGLGIPFVMDYAPVWTGLGIIAGYGIVVLGMSGFLRARLGPRWAYVHRFTGLAWAMSVAHTIGAGSDAGAPGMIAILGVCVAPVVVLLGMRIRAGRRRPGTGAAVRPSPHARAQAVMRGGR